MCPPWPPLKEWLKAWALADENAKADAELEALLMA
jgi:hypothetical protein